MSSKAHVLNYYTGLPVVVGSIALDLPRKPVIGSFLIKPSGVVGSHSGYGTFQGNSRVQD